MRSPGRPEINQRLIKQAFWENIAVGLQSEDAARACGVSQPLGPRWFRQAGGIAPTNLRSTSGRYLSFAEREEISLLHAQQLGVREIARRLERSSSTISRELRRNAATRCGNGHSVFFINAQHRRDHIAGAIGQLNEPNPDFLFI